MMQILDHPTIQRVLAGETITAQQLREAFVDFWQENGTFEICAQCPVPSYANQPRERGCCCACKDWKEGVGCTQRNLRCLAHTCTHLEDFLRKGGLWVEFQNFRDLIFRGPLSMKEPYFNHARLPDEAPIFVSVSDWSWAAHPVLDSTWKGEPRAAQAR